MVSKKATDFRKGDSVEFRCQGTVVRNPLFYVKVALDELHDNSEISVLPKTLTSLPAPRELTLEDRMELPVDAFVVRAVERAIRRSLGPGAILDESLGDEPLGEVALACIDAIYNIDMNAKRRPEDFKEGDRVEFRCRATVMSTAPQSVVIGPHVLDHVSALTMTVPRTTVTHLSEPTRIELDENDGLVGVVEDAIKNMFNHNGQLTDTTEKVALAAVDAVYCYHRKN